jgi:hypothetical protein
MPYKTKLLKWAILQGKLGGTYEFDIIEVLLVDDGLGHSNDQPHILLRLTLAFVFATFCEFERE